MWDTYREMHYQSLKWCLQYKHIKKILTYPEPQNDNYFISFIKNHKDY